MTLLAKIILGWMFLALFLSMFIGSFFRKGLSPEAETENKDN